MQPEPQWPAAPGGESLSPPLSVHDLRGFAGSSAYAGPHRGFVDYYVPRWAEALTRGETHAGFNWAAALFGSNWCFWRKLYGLALMILAAEIVTTLLLALIVVQGFSLEPELATVNAVGWAALLPIRGLLGYHANTLYLSKAIAAAGWARAEHADPALRQASIAEVGGTSRLVLGVALGFQLLVMAGPLFSA